MSKQELQTFHIPKKIEKNGLQLRNFNVEVDRQIILTLNETIIESKSSEENEECILKSNNKCKKIKKNSKITSNIHVKSNFVCYNVNIETTNNEASEENPEISEKKLSKFQLLRERLKRNKKKPLKEPSGDKIITLEDNLKTTPESEISKEHVKGVLEYLSKHKESDVESIKEESEKPQPRTLGYRLLHSRLRPDTSQTSNLIIPDLKYTLTPDTLAKASYPKTDPPPVFKPYVPVKSYLPRSSSSGFVNKNKAEVEDTESDVSHELVNVLSEHSKLIKSRENIRYDIIFGNLQNYDGNAIPEDEPVKVPNDRLNSESETTVAVVEEPQEVLVRESSTDSNFINDIIDDLLLGIPPRVQEEPETDAVEIVKPIVESLVEEIPEKKSRNEIIPIIEILVNEILKNESEIRNKVSSVPAFSLEEKVLDQKISEIEIEMLEDSSKCNKECKYKTICDARRGAEPNLDNDSRIESKPVVLKECRASQIPIFKGRKRYENKIKDVKNLNVLEICECKPSNGSDKTRSSKFSLDNEKKSDRFENKPVCCTKCIIEDSKSVEKELQTYDFNSNCVTRNYENLKSTMYDLVLDMAFANSLTQTCNSFTRTDKNTQTNNCPITCTSAEKEKLYMYIPKNSNAARKFLEDTKRNTFQRTNQINLLNPKEIIKIKSHHSYKINPNVEIIFKSKYITAHQQHAKVNPQFVKQPVFRLPYNNLPTQKDCKVFFINPKVKKRKQEIRTDISGDTTTNNYTSEFSFKNVSEKFSNTSKTSVENELIYSKKITDIPSRYKTEETKFASFQPDIVCYNIETSNINKRDENTDDAINKKITTRKEKKSSKRIKKIDNKDSNNHLSDPHDHYFLTDYPDQIHKESVHTVESHISKEPIKWKTSRRRLLHSKLRPDSSKSSNIVLPDIDYTLSTEKLPKPKYPKNVPPPVFKQVGSYKGKIPVMTSKERLRQRTKLRKDEQQLENLKKKESKELQQSKFLKRKENTQYDILFGKDNPEEIAEEYQDDESLESQHKKQSATRRLLKRFKKRPKSESEIEITMIESPRPITKSSSVNLLLLDDDDKDSEVEEPNNESEEESEEELEQIPKQALEQEPAQEGEEVPKQEPEQELELAPDQEVEKEAEQIPEVELSEVELEEEDEEDLEEMEYDEEIVIEDYFEEEPNKENLVEIIPKKESQITAIENLEIPIEIEKPKSKTEKQPCVDECTEPCSNTLPHDDTNTRIKPRIKKRLVIFKECDSQLCTYDKDKECNKLMINIGTSSRENRRSVEIVHSNRKAFITESQSSQRCSNDYNPIEVKSVAVGNHRHESFQPNYRNSIENRSETTEQELQTTSRNSHRNNSKSSQRNRKTKNIKKSTYDSKEVLYEKELQNYDYVTDCVSRNYQNIKATDHNLLLDLNFQNKITQTYHSQKKEKNMQTANYFPSNQKQCMSVPRKKEPSSNYNSYSKNTLQVSSRKNFKIIHKTPLGVPQLLIINHPTSRYQSPMSKPTIDIIYKNTKYLSPKYVKTIIPHENSQKILSVNNRKYSYDNNFQNNLQNNKSYRTFAYFVNVQQEPKDNNLQHSLNLKTIDRDLIIKFV